MREISINRYFSQYFIQYMDNLNLFINESDYNTLKKSLKYPNVSYISSINKPKIKKYLYSGTPDIDGLRSIGWTENDIEYYRQYGVNWEEKDNSKHLVPEYDKQIKDFGFNNDVGSYNFTEVTYCPKFELTSRTHSVNAFFNFKNLTFIPLLDFSKITRTNNTFMHCKKLTSIPLIDISNVTDSESMFGVCESLRTIPKINTSNIINANSMFAFCLSLRSLPLLDFSKLESGNYMFKSCSELTSIEGFKNLKCSLDFRECKKLTHKSLINILINLGNVYNKTLFLGETNLLKLTEKEKNIATHKGWKLV